MKYADIRTCSACGAQNRVPARNLSDTGRCGSCKSALPPVSTPLDVDATAFDEIIGSAKVPVLVDFWASWCGPCKMVAPEVAAVARELSGRAVVLKVDTERNPELSSRYSVRSIPYFMVFENGREVMNRAGAMPRSELLRLLEGRVRT